LETPEIEIYTPT